FRAHRTLSDERAEVRRDARGGDAIEERLDRQRRRSIRTFHDRRHALTDVVVGGRDLEDAESRARMGIDVDGGNGFSRRGAMARRAGASRRGAVRAMLSPRIARSRRYHGLPVPSMIRPLRIRRSNAAGACARGTTSRPVSSATAHAGIRTLRMRPSVAECVQLRIWNLEFGMRTSPPVVSGFNRTGSRIPNSKFLIPNSA